MAMHYLCESEEKIRLFFQKISERLAPGGYFIGTCPDSNVLVSKLRQTVKKKDNTYNFGNDYYSV
jgi:mRNA (guanine-N7-)-methyltransferase